MYFESVHECAAAPIFTVV